MKKEDIDVEAAVAEGWKLIVVFGSGDGGGGGAWAEKTDWKDCWCEAVIVMVTEEHSWWLRCWDTRTSLENGWKAAKKITKVVKKWDVFLFHLPLKSKATVEEKVKIQWWKVVIF